MGDVATKLRYSEHGGRAVDVPFEFPSGCYCRSPGEILLCFRGVKINWTMRTDDSCWKICSKLLSVS